MTRRFRIGILLIIIALTTYLAYLIMVPFFAPLMWATVFAIVFYPVYLYILRYVRRPALTSLITVVIVLVVLLGPISYLFYLLVGEIENLASITITADNIRSAYQNSFIHDLANRVLPVFRLDEDQVISYAVNGLSILSKQLLRLAPGSLGSIANAFTTFIIMAFVLFFFFKNGSRYVVDILDLLPFSEKHQQELSSQVKDVIVSTIYGGVAVAIAQGIVGAVGFLSVGVPSPVLWGLATAFASFIPFVGSHIVWVPICLYLLITGHIIKAIILVAFGIFGIGLVDNVVRPLFIRGRARLSFLLTFFSVLGGIQAFGLIGIVVGPLIMALYVSLIAIVKNFDDNGQQITMIEAPVDHVTTAKSKHQINREKEL